MQVFMNHHEKQWAYPVLFGTFEDDDEFYCYFGRGDMWRFPLVPCFRVVH